MLASTFSKPLTTGIVHEIVSAAGCAPSPDNNQPWAFAATDDGIDVLHVRERAIASDVEDLFSWLGVGAAVENLVLAASRHHLAAEIVWHARPWNLRNGHEHIATVRFSDQGVPDPLAEQITPRITNRRPYQKTTLTDPERQRLESAASILPECRVQWLLSQPLLKRLARIVYATDRIRFECQPFHEELHHALRYSRAEAERSRDGLDIATLEIPRPAWPLLKWLRPWRRMAFLNSFGMSRIFARNSTTQIVRSGAVGLLTVEAATDTAYLDGGRAFQRIWLAATELGLSLQPVGALPLFLRRLAVLGPAAFRHDHALRLGAIAKEFHALYSDGQSRIPVMLFRVGHAAAPAARSYRLLLDQILQN